MEKEKDPFRPGDYWESRLSAHWGLHGVGYLGLNAWNNWIYRVKASVFDRAIRSLGLRKGFAALDIGCGTGFFIDRWLRLGATSLMGMDLTEVAVTRLRASFPSVRFVQGDVSETAARPGDNFDAISMIDVLFHIVDEDRYAAALRNIHGMLGSNGHFVFSEFFLHGQPSIGRHHVSRTLAHIEDGLGKAGFAIISRKPMHVLMNQPLDTRSAMPKAVWDRFTGALEDHEWLGTAAGALLYPIDSALVRILRESPTTEIMVCKKI
jgi:SAM-dependent methyltransferase